MVGFVWVKIIRIEAMWGSLGIVVKLYYLEGKVGEKLEGMFWNVERLVVFWESGVG